MIPKQRLKSVRAALPIAISSYPGICDDAIALLPLTDSALETYCRLLIQFHAREGLTNWAEKIERSLIALQVPPKLAYVLALCRRDRRIKRELGIWTRTDLSKFTGFVYDIILLIKFIASWSISKSRKFLNN
jgi:hypothetical protein